MNKCEFFSFYSENFYSGMFKGGDTFGLFVEFFLLLVIFVTFHLFVGAELFTSSYNYFWDLDISVNALWSFSF